MIDRKSLPLEEESDPRWRIGDGPDDIKLEDLVLVSIHHVSLGSWQPHLRLVRPRPWLGGYLHHGLLPLTPTSTPQEPVRFLEMDPGQSQSPLWHSAESRSASRSPKEENFDPTHIIFKVEGKYLISAWTAIYSTNLIFKTQKQTQIKAASCGMTPRSTMH